MEKSKKKSLRLVLAAIMVLIFFQLLGIFNFFEQGLVKILVPLQIYFYHLGSSLSQITELQDIISENNKLKEEFSKFSIDYIKLASLEAENDYFRSELNYLKKNSYRFQMANIIGRLPLNDQILIINKGKNDGLVPGLAVTVAQGVIVGKILKADDQTSFVELLTNTQSSLAAGFASQSGTNGLVVGKAGLNLVMDFITQDQKIPEQEVVVTSGLEELIPKGLLIGEVGEVQSQVGQIFKQAKVIPVFNYQNLQTLTVILN